MELQEDTIENGVRMSPWMIAGNVKLAFFSIFLVIKNSCKNINHVNIWNLAQLKLLGAFDANGPDLTEITVTTELVPGSDIGEVKPKVIGKLQMNKVKTDEIILI